MDKTAGTLIFTGIVTKEPDEACYASLCPELNVASQGDTLDEARAMLLDAVAGYLELCFEQGAAYLRELAPEADPRREMPEAVVAVFPLVVGFSLSASVGADMRHSAAYETMLASEAVLSRDWDSPEEDAAWAAL